MLLRCPQPLGDVAFLHFLHIRAHLSDALFQFRHLTMQLPVLAFKPAHFITAQQRVDAVECCCGGLGS